MLADSDLGDDDTDGAGLETEGEDGHRSVVTDGGIVEVTTGTASAATYSGPSHSVHHQPDGTIHMCVEDVALSTHGTQGYSITQ